MVRRCLTGHGSGHRKKKETLGYYSWMNSVEHQLIWGMLPSPESLDSVDFRLRLGIHRILTHCNWNQGQYALGHGPYQTVPHVPGNKLKPFGISNILVHPSLRLCGAITYFQLQLSKLETQACSTLQTPLNKVA